MTRLLGLPRPGTVSVQWQIKHGPDGNDFSLAPLIAVSEANNVVPAVPTVAVNLVPKMR